MGNNKINPYLMLPTNYIDIIIKEAAIAKTIFFK